MNARTLRSNLNLADGFGRRRICVATIGCGTTRTSNTARTATEQLLISDAVDRTVQQINFKVLAGEAVFFDTSQMNDVVDKGYVISCMRQHLLACGCVMKEKREDATFIIEPRVGVVGTDSHDLMFGIPAFNVPQVATATRAAVVDSGNCVREAARSDGRRQDCGVRLPPRDGRAGVAVGHGDEQEHGQRHLAVRRRAVPEGNDLRRDALRRRRDRRRATKTTTTTRAELGRSRKRKRSSPGRRSKAKQQSGVMQASAEMPVDAAAGPPVLPPPARPIAEAPKPAEANEDPATTAG